ncbi:hypothetical protein [Streptomyces sp. SID3343]|uniref:hypothetical protein n=1 Tax=Streptomyces sp. SID3343 TaxID=2690260 RepID=UPI00136A42A3|nr:hypothetical protein [Streptomyces sp. SID3343]MYW06049.1 hypothetical protein [Streptomyces sp. SID3343]
MSLKPRTFFTIACDGRGCGALYEQATPDGDVDCLLLESAAASAAWVPTLLADDWLASTHRHLCPPCAKRAALQVVERLEIEITHDPLF